MVPAQRCRASKMTPRRCRERQPPRCHGAVIIATSLMMPLISSCGALLTLWRRQLLPPPSSAAFADVLLRDAAHHCDMLLPLLRDTAVRQ